MKDNPSGKTSDNIEELEGIVAEVLQRLGIPHPESLVVHKNTATDVALGKQQAKELLYRGQFRAYNKYMKFCESAKEKIPEGDWYHDLSEARRYLDRSLDILEAWVALEDNAADLLRFNMAIQTNQKRELEIMEKYPKSFHEIYPLVRKLAVAGYDKDLEESERLKQEILTLEPKFDHWDVS